MAETAPPTTSAPTGPTSTTTAPTPGATEQNGTNRGLPYYEKLRRELRDTLQKKRLMDKSMAQLEDQIFRFEQSYLEETTAGNIIKGFDNYIKGSSAASNLGATTLGLSSAGAGTLSRRKAQVSDIDRVFSRSSASFMRDSPAPSSAVTTPSHAPTPSSTYNGPMSVSNRSNNDGVSSAAGSVKGGASKNKKKASVGGGGNNREKNHDDDGEDGEKPPVKRLKISYGRD
ncbi:hypothetical protein ASPZODRAFT_130620 [Penicilliopsis zonata CBS 506.65]|uniref:Chromatin modification-related protein EAF6 n=1 Tax=Penicilliopsis zonata CBS 506.65 TaxID=1073090 RepID=A0A1L9SMV2_9EURO|nr:hypothetical protein ASPZODRAFT_130620 [Penicilliopsis zonata CBS 506.65]OJJ48555.1 hypothetical protein ASPZODRAFT_130620 [Penicilliopsis zonata CBS 506.65]